MARAQSSRNSEGHYSGRGNVINVINLKLIPSWAFPRMRNIPSEMNLNYNYCNYNQQLKVIIIITIIIYIKNFFHGLLLL